MNQRKKGLLAAALCAALLLGGLMLPGLGSSSSSAIYLMAVNEKVVTMTAENMPMMVNGTLYVPYTLLTSRVTEINLRVTALYSTTKRTLLVSGGQKAVTFDTRANTAVDIQGNALDVRAAVRNNMVFLPLDWLCSYFDAIDYSLIPTQYGTLVRITNSDAILGDEEFADAAKGKLAENLRKYQDSIVPSASPTPSATPVPTPAVQPSTPPVQPSAPPPPVQSQPPAVQNTPPPSQPPEEGAELYLALRWGGQGEQAAQLLESYGLRGLFLFTCEELRDNDDAVRRLVGAGHSIGLDAAGAEGGECLELAAEGRKLLADIARCGTAIVSGGGLDQDSRETLLEAGYVLWDAAVQGGRYSSGEALVRSLDIRHMNYVELSCGDGELAFLRSALSAMDSASCTVLQPTAPVLA